MKVLKILIFMMVMVSILAFYLVENSLLEEKLPFLKDTEDMPNSSKEHESLTPPPTDESLLYEWINVDEETLLKSFGEPKRIDVTPYGYEWYIYNFENYYVQFGVKEDKIVTAFSNSEEAPLGDVEIGGSYEQLDDYYSFERSESLKEATGTYTFELTEGDIRKRPFSHIENDVWGQFYFDEFENKLSSVRYSTEDVLLVQRPYSLTYSGELPEVEELTHDDNRAWEEGLAQQIFDLTNHIRNHHDLNVLEWHEAAADTAYGHSREMSEEDYFSHTSPVTGSLGDRLDQHEINYLLAAENIAANHLDSIEAVEGWMNSEGHRLNILNEEFTHLGVGVYNQHYTQNFITDNRP
ncbi:CAP domain-containing protein [Salipaludibacillus agaradhaerens]|uniref:CAP domain-containing protein n=1 Tax=Salipaludibacillus agaradhaerens TaxID=76935 RepID=UPI00099886CA|nr:CAP domain-containing protein [Salipaludibacillus agaradhaerens]